MKKILKNNKSILEMKKLCKLIFPNKIKKINT